MTKEVEDIIKTKAYFELSADELKQVSEYAQTEEEYVNMQWFLNGAAGVFATDKIEASPDLKKGVMAHLTESKKKKGFWLNSVGVFMLPEGKKFYQKPAFQLGIAAVAVLGFLFFFNNNMNESTLASNDLKVEENTLEESNQPSTPVDTRADGDQQEDIDELNKDLERDQLVNLQDEEILGLVVEQELTEELNEMTTDSYESEPEMAPPPLIFEEISIVEDEEEVAESIDLDDEVERKTEEAIVSVETEKLNNTSESNGSGFFKRDRSKNKTQKSAVELDKKEVSQEDAVVSSDLAPAADSSVPGTTNLGGNSGYSNEWITPKSLHINKTKELNQLFYIEK